MNGSQNWMSMLPLILLMAIFYFLMVRPQQKREKNRQQTISELKAGDKVVLISGFKGKVIRPGETSFIIELAKGVHVEVERNAIAARDDSAEKAVEA